VIKLTPELQATSFFAPTDAGTLNTTDSDLGSTGPVLLPGSRAFIIGKSGVGYLLSTRDLGGIGHALASTGLGAAFGGAAQNPTRVLPRILGAIHDDNGRITIPGFYDSVRELPLDIRRHSEALGLPAEGFLCQVGLRVPAGGNARPGCSRW